jgi:hypothetical protein
MKLPEFGQRQLPSVAHWPFQSATKLWPKTRVLHVRGAQGGDDWDAGNRRRPPGFSASPPCPQRRRSGDNVRADFLLGQQRG